jgi:hypothetical protein
MQGCAPRLRVARAVGHPYPVDHGEEADRPKFAFVPCPFLGIQRHDDLSQGVRPPAVPLEFPEEPRQAFQHHPWEFLDFFWAPVVWSPGLLLGHASHDPSDGPGCESTEGHAGPGVLVEDAGHRVVVILPKLAPLSDTSFNSLADVNWAGLILPVQSFHAGLRPDSLQPAIHGSRSGSHIALYPITPRLFPHLPLLLAGVAQLFRERIKVFLLVIAAGLPSERVALLRGRRRGAAL